MDKKGVKNSSTNFEWVDYRPLIVFLSSNEIQLATIFPQSLNQMTNFTKKISGFYTATLLKKMSIVLIKCILFSYYQLLFGFCKNCELVWFLIFLVKSIDLLLVECYQLRIVCRKQRYFRVGFHLGQYVGKLSLNIAVQIRIYFPKINIFDETSSNR